MLDQLAKEAFRRIGLTVRISILPCERSIRSANQGIDDGDLTRIEGINRLYSNLIQVPEKTITFEFVAFTKMSNRPLSNWKSLAPYHVGVIRGWKILEKNAAGAASLTKVENAMLLFTLLRKNRVDLILYERIQGYGMIKELNISGLRVLEPPLAVRDMYLYLHKKHKSIVLQLAVAMKVMKQDGTYAKIVRESLRLYVP